MARKEDGNRVQHILWDLLLDDGPDHTRCEDHFVYVGPLNVDILVRLLRLVLQQ